MSELFIELLSEEIPYWLQKNIVEQFKTKLHDVIIENQLSGSETFNIDFHFTPLRLIFFCDNLINEQKSSTEIIKGPAVDAPDTAIEGFIKNIGVNKIIIWFFMALQIIDQRRMRLEFYGMIKS